MEEVGKFLQNAELYINTRYKTYTPVQIIIEVLISVVVLYYASSILSWDFSDIKGSVMRFIFKKARLVPAVRKKIEGERIKVKEMMKKKLGLKDLPVNYSIPQKGLPRDEIIKTMAKYQEEEEKHYSDGKVSGALYTRNKEHMNMVNQAYSLYSYSNSLHPEMYPSIRKYEIEVIRMTADMMNGNDEVCGIITSGGTESILMACKTYRDRANVKHPEMIIPVTAHAAFNKAGQYFGIKVRCAPVDPVTQLANPKTIRSMVNKNTIMIVGSAPQFPHGVVDPIPELAKIAKEYNIGFHTDCCLGGFFVPWLKKLGVSNIPNFDFSVDGVTSMSVDTHKYGMTNKGSSVLLFKNEDWRRSMYFVITDWPGGVYASPAMAGSRPGGVVASAWASLMATGKEGFMETTETIWKAVQTIKKGVEENKNLVLVTPPQTSIVSFTSKTLDIFKVSDGMSKLGWHLNTLQRPNAIHICLTNSSMHLADQFVADLNKAVQMVVDNPQGFPDGLAPMYGMTASLPDRSAVADVALGFIDGMMSAQQ